MLYDYFLYVYGSYLLHFLVFYLFFTSDWESESKPPASALELSY